MEEIDYQNYKCGQAWYLTPIIPAISWEAEIGRITVPG
jgi:hypothetical protein